MTKKTAIEASDPEPTPRWKCPDCSVWVRDDVKEHKCASASTSPNPWTITGWTCSRCGGWVTSNNYHMCSRWQYPYTVTNTANSATPNNGVIRYSIGNTGSSAA